MVALITYSPVTSLINHSLEWMWLSLALVRLDSGKLTPFEFTLFPDNDPRSHERQVFLQYNRDTAMPSVVWGALKAYLRGLFIRQISSIKTNTKEWKNLVLSEARKAEEA